MASGGRPFEDHVDAEASRFFGDDGAHVVFGGVEGVIGVHFCCQLAAVFVDFDGEDGGCADGSRDCNREQADGAAAGDGHGFGGDFSGEDGVHGVAEGIEDGRVFLRDGGSSFQIFDRG